MLPKDNPQGIKVLKCNTKDACSNGLCRCMKNFYMEFAEVLYKDLVGSSQDNIFENGGLEIEATAEICSRRKLAMIQGKTVGRAEISKTRAPISSPSSNWPTQLSHPPIHNYRSGHIPTQMPTTTWPYTDFTLEIVAHFQQIL